MLTRCAVLAVALLAAARPARADAVADYKNGSTVMLRVASARAGSQQRSTGEVAVTKRPGTLDFYVAAADLGMPISVTLHLHGTDLGNGLLLFTFDEPVSPAADIGDGQLLSRLTGQLYAQVQPVAGRDTPQVGNAWLTLVPGGGSMQAYGTWGTQWISIDQVDVIGGFAQPALVDFVNDGDAVTCSDTSIRTEAFAVWIADAAPSGGAVVDLKGPRAGGVRLPQHVIVPAGKRMTNVIAQVDPGFTGTAHVTAAAGGVTRALDVVVQPATACVSGPANGPSVTKWIPDATSGCTGCTTYLDHNKQSEMLATINGRLSVVRGRTVIDLLRTFSSASAVGAAAMNADGTITGTITIGGVVSAYRANMNHATPTPELLGGMTPAAIDNYDAVVGSATINGVSRAVYSNGHGVIALPISSSYGVVSSNALDVTDDGQVIGTFTDNTGVMRGFRWAAGVTTTLPAFGTKPAIPVAISRDGHIAVIGANRSGLPVSAIISPTGVVRDPGVPTGYSTFEARSINQFGAVVGVASYSSGFGKVQRAFAWTPSRGFVALTGYVANLVATDALRITDTNQVVVRGTYNGVADLYLVTL